MIHSRTSSFEFVPQFQGNAKATDPAKVMIRVMSFAEVEGLGVLLSDAPDMSSRLFREFFVSCSGIVDADGCPLKTADAILNAPGLRNLVLECIKAFNVENGMSELKKKD